MFVYGVHNSSIQKDFDQLFSSIYLEQSKYNQLAPANASKSEKMQQYIQEYTALKGRGVFYDYLSTGRGHGPFTQLVDDSVKYDLIGGIGVGILGHSHPLVIKAHLEAATSDTIHCGNLLSYPEPFVLSKNLLKQVESSNLKHFWFAGSGSFANDTALKILWQKMAPKYKVIAFEKAFAGRSIATQNITDTSAYRVGMPTSLEVCHVPHYDSKNPIDSLQNTIQALDKVWLSDPDNFCCIMIELIQGEAGFIYGDKSYYQGICNWAKDKGIYIWIDEVQTFARTTELFAFQYFALDQMVDIVTVGKALQACGTFYTAELNPAPGLISGTFNGSIAALNAGNKIVDYLTNGNFYGKNGRIKQLENTFVTKLNHLAQNSCKGMIGHIGGIGTMIAFELIPSEKEITIQFVKKLFNNGIIAFIAGSNPTRVRFLLPVCLKDEHIAEIFSIIEKTLHQIYKEE